MRRLITVVIIIAALRCTAATADTLDDVRGCESRDDYGIVSSNGLYHGAYQFDLVTWYSVGGLGYPELASPEEQDYRAGLLYQQRGCTPWPNCCYVS